MKWIKNLFKKKKKKTKRMPVKELNRRRLEKQRHLERRRKEKAERDEELDEIRYETVKAELEARKLKAEKKKAEMEYEIDELENVTDVQTEINAYQESGQPVHWSEDLINGLMAGVVKNAKSKRVNSGTEERIIDIDEEPSSDTQEA